MLSNASVVAHRQWRGINEVDTATLPIAASQVGIQGYQHRWDQFDEAIVADQLRKLVGQVHLHVSSVVGLEITVVYLMKMWIRITMISLGYNCPTRRHCFRLLCTNSVSHTGANICKKPSTWQYSSSKLISDAFLLVVVNRSDYPCSSREASPYPEPKSLINRGFYKCTKNH
jgi:hypothetical protein